MLNPNTTRTIARWIHLVFSIPILGYIYGPFEEIPKYALRRDLSSYHFWSLPGCGCGKAIWFAACFLKQPPDTMLTIRECEGITE